MSLKPNLLCLDKNAPTTFNDDIYNWICKFSQVNHIFLHKSANMNIFLHKFANKNIFLHKFAYKNIFQHKFANKNIFLHKFAN